MHVNTLIEREETGFFSKGRLVVVVLTEGFSVNQVWEGEYNKGYLQNEGHGVEIYRSAEHTSELQLHS